MKFLADENVDAQIIKRLRDDGHTIIYIAETEPSISDIEIMQTANHNQALLITGDKDFGELVFRQRHILYGVILIRLAGLSPQDKADIVSLAIKKHLDELEQNFIVITPGAVRIRKQHA